MELTDCPHANTPGQKYRKTKVVSIVKDENYCKLNKKTIPSVSPISASFVLFSYFSKLRDPNNAAWRRCT